MNGVSGFDGKLGMRVIRGPQSRTQPWLQRFAQRIRDVATRRVKV